MKNDITYETLWQVAQKEKSTNELQLLPKTFYEEIHAFVTDLEKEESREAQTTKKNTVSLVDELYERRKQKIMLYVAYKKPIPQPAIQKEIDFYNRLLDTSKENRLEISEDAKPGTKTLRALQNLPEIILPSGKRIGPLEKNQILELKENEEDIKFLLNNTICEKI